MAEHDLKSAARAEWQKELHRLFPHAKLDEPLSRHTTFRIGGPADALVDVSAFRELGALFAFIQRHSLPAFMLGRGSNVLVLDGGIRGVVVRLRGRFEDVEFEPFAEASLSSFGARGGARVRVGAGVRLPTLVVACAERGFAGAESLVGVPGSLGGALVMNAGTREGEIGDLVRGVRVFDPKFLKEAWIGFDLLRFGYRSSNLEGRIVLQAELELKQGSKVDILTMVREFQKRRQQTQPIHTYNVGSTFKNPPGRFVAKLIEEAGLKGARCGGAKISEMHANFFENDGDASARDVLSLVELARQKIRERFGVELELEMKVVGEA